MTELILKWKQVGYETDLRLPKIYFLNLNFNQQVSLSAHDRLFFCTFSPFYLQIKCSRLHTIHWHVLHVSKKFSRWTCPYFDWAIECVIPLGHVITTLSNIETNFCREWAVDIFYTSHDPNMQLKATHGIAGDKNVISKREIITVKAIIVSFYSPWATLLIQSKYRWPPSSYIYWPWPRTIFKGLLR